MTSKVYFTRKLTPETLVEMYKKLGVKQVGKLGLKIHSGEKNGPYFLKPSFLDSIYNSTGGTYIECNAAYKNFFSDGVRYNSELHKQSLKDNGWGNKRFVLMDENPDKDIKLDIEGGEVIKVDYVGEHIADFDSLLVLAHFKGHPMSGFGGALKQLGIGCASRRGKSNIHTAGKVVNDWEKMLDPSNPAEPAVFAKAVAEAASAVHKYFKKKNKGGPVYINVMKDISLYCDCTGVSAPKPEIGDKGVLISTDPVAIDQACVDIIKNCKDGGKEKMLKQIDDLKGEVVLDVAEKLGVGSRKYQLIFEKGDGPN